MYTNPELFNSQKLSTRVYVSFYHNNVRVSEYSGRSLGLKIFPGKAKTIAQRTLLLKLLRDKLEEALVLGLYKAEPIEVISLESTLQKALDRKLSTKLSETYKRDLKFIHKRLMEFLTPDEKSSALDEITAPRVAEFLEKFNSSNSYYMNKRTDLGVLFSSAGRILNLSIGMVQKTERRLPDAKLNIPYSKEQVKPLLEYFREQHKKLYIACMLTCSAWLRPHMEIRRLIKGQFSADYSVITLAGVSNKGKRVRVVYVPEYAQEIVREILDQISADQNIFSGTTTPYYKDYFKTAWGRLREDLLKEKLIRESQTIYSFRHTAAVLMYRKTKDIYLLQKLLGHRSVQVTERYLRGLGEVDIQELRDAAPDL